MNQTTELHPHAVPAAPLADVDATPQPDADGADHASALKAESLKAAIRRHMKSFDVAAARAALQQAIDQHPEDPAVLSEAAEFDVMCGDFPAFIDKVTAFEQATGQLHSMHAVLDTVRPLGLPNLRSAVEAAYAWLHEHLPAGVNQMTGIAVQPGRIAIVCEFMLDQDKVAAINQALEKVTVPLLGNYADRFRCLCLMSDKYPIRELARAAAALTLLRLKLGDALADTPDHGKND